MSVISCTSLTYKQDCLPSQLWIFSLDCNGSIPSGLLDDDYQESLHGAIGFTVNNEVIPSLKPRMLNLTFGEYLSKNGTLNQRNPWFPEYLASRIGCTFKNVVNVSSGKTNLCKPEDRLNENEFFTLSYMQNYADAVLAIATALQKYLKKTCGDFTGLCPKVKDALNGIDLANGVFEILKNISFPGINKQNFTFDQNQDGSAVYKIKTFVKRDPSEGAPINNWETAGLFRSGEITWYEEPRSLEEINSVCSSPCEVGFAKKIETQMCCWQCQACLPQQYVGFNGTECLECPRGNSPTLDRKDCRTNEMSRVRYSDPYSIASLIIASVGIVVTFTVSIIYFRNRNTPIVKAAGKEISVIVLVGAMFCFMNSFVLSTEATEIICVISRLLLACGPTLMYAGILTKTIVVVVIFKSKKILYSNIKAYLLPKYQIVAAVILSLIQVMILLAWFFFNPPNASVYYPSLKESFLVCNDVEDLIVLIGLAYPFLLILSCTILATINRKVPTGFNETQYIGFTMYATCIIWIAFLPIFITSSSVISLKVAAVSICLSLSAITVLVCLFCTRCYVIIFNPEENTSKSVMSSVCQRGTLSTPAITNQTTKMSREASYSDAKLSKTKQKERASWKEGKKLDGEGDNTQSCAHCGTKL
ncbi:metabotropic glutamate receptor-like [Clavelina lepadiformis]|uniref:metabotropic glutamate receptor-like n=1 Tax=Clavelina lepadiformis TaxID=159417 RepID=UPI004041152C